MPQPTCMSLFGKLAQTLGLSDKRPKKDPDQTNVSVKDAATNTKDLKQPHPERKSPSLFAKAAEVPTAALADGAVKPAESTTCPAFAAKSVVGQRCAMEDSWTVVPDLLAIPQSWTRHCSNDRLPHAMSLNTGFNPRKAESMAAGLQKCIQAAAAAQDAAKAGQEASAAGGADSATDGVGSGGAEERALGRPSPLRFRASAVGADGAAATEETSSLSAAVAAAAAAAAAATKAAPPPSIPSADPPSLAHMSAPEKCTSSARTMTVAATPFRRVSLPGHDGGVGRAGPTMVGPSDAVQGGIPRSCGPLVPVHFFAVYDGHGGADVAKFCSRKLHEHLRDIVAHNAATALSSSRNTGDFSRPSTPATSTCTSALAGLSRTRLNLLGYPEPSTAQLPCQDAPHSPQTATDEPASADIFNGHGLQGDGISGGNGRLDNGEKSVKSQSSGEDSSAGRAGGGSLNGKVAATAPSSTSTAATSIDAVALVVEDFDGAHHQTHTTSKVAPQSQPTSQGQEQGCLLDVAAAQPSIPSTHIKPEPSALYADGIADAAADGALAGDAAPVSGATTQTEGTREASLSNGSDAIIERSLIKAFVQVDTELAAAHTANEVGSTAVVSLLGAGHLWVANCGDSRAVLCRTDGEVLMSRDHKANRSDEVSRVEAAGGFVWWERVMGELAVSRAIGDHCLRPYVIATPEVTRVARRAEDQLLVLASDGLWDVLSNHDVCVLALREFKAELERGGSARAAVKRCASLLVKAALAKGSRDNVTALVVDVRLPHTTHDVPRKQSLAAAGLEGGGDSVQATTATSTAHSERGVDSAPPVEAAAAAVPPQPPLPLMHTTGQAKTAADEKSDEKSDVPHVVLPAVTAARL